MQKPSPHPNDAKRKTLEKLNEAFSKSRTILMADYTRMTVADISEFRKQCKKESVEVFVTKNTLAKLALTEFPEIAPYLRGQTIFLYSSSDAVAPIRVLMSYSKKNNNRPEIRGSLFDGVVFDASKTEQLKDLPSKEQLIAQVIGLLEVPMSQLVGVLQEILRGVPAVLESVSNKN